MRSFAPGPPRRLPSHDKFRGWIDDRTGLADAWRGLAAARGRGGTGLAAGLARCGRLRLLHPGSDGPGAVDVLQPRRGSAWESVYYLQYHVQGGWLLRAVHHYAAQVMLVLVVVWLVQMIVGRAYRRAAGSALLDRRADGAGDAGLEPHWRPLALGPEQLLGHTGPHRVSAAAAGHWRTPFPVGGGRAGFRPPDAHPLYGLARGRLLGRLWDFAVAALPLGAGKGDSPIFAHRRFASAGRKSGQSPRRAAKGDRHLFRPKGRKTSQSPRGAAKGDRHLFRPEGRKTSQSPRSSLLAAAGAARRGGVRGGHGGDSRPCLAKRPVARASGDRAGPAGRSGRGLSGGPAGVVVPRPVRTPRLVSHQPGGRARLRHSRPGGAGAAGDALGRAVTRRPLVQRGADRGVGGGPGGALVASRWPPTRGTRITRRRWPRRAGGHNG